VAVTATGSQTVITFSDLLSTVVTGSSQHEVIKIISDISLFLLGDPIYLLLNSYKSTHKIKIE